MFRECLRSHIIPFIVKDKNKHDYYEALRAYQKEESIDALRQFFLQEQNEYFDMGIDFVVPFSDQSVEQRIQDALETKRKRNKTV